MHWTSTDPSSGLAVVLGTNTYITSGLSTTGEYAVGIQIRKSKI